MTTAEQFRSVVTHPASREVSIAGVPWPAYKVLALVVGLLVFGVVAIASASAGPAVLAATAAATVVWLVCGVLYRSS
jgi:hypothetical protein